MKFVELIQQKQNDNMNQKVPTVAFLGDSVTQGCFEVYQDSEGNIGTVFDKNCAYHNYFARIFSVLYPSVPINIINAGINGDTAPHGYERLERDVLAANPDLVIVCYGLNDSSLGAGRLGEYIEGLENIFIQLKRKAIDVIFMTPNLMNTQVSCHISSPFFQKIAEETAKTQNQGIMDLYIDSARDVCQKHKVPICDCYAKWKVLQERGVKTTELLSNKINHPTREMNWLFAYALAEAILKIE